MSEVTRKKEKKERNIVGKILQVLQCICSILLVGSIFYMNILPVKYLVAVIVILILFFVLLFFLLKRRKPKWRFILAAVLSLVLSMGMILGSIYLFMTRGTLDNIASNTTQTTTVSVYVLKDSTAKNISDVKNGNFGILKEMDRTNTDKAVSSINKKVGLSIKTTELENLQKLADSLLNKKTDAIIMNASYLSMYEEMDGYTTFKDQVRVIHQKKIVSKIKSKKNGMADGVFALYISGSDTRGALNSSGRSDVNVIAYVNTKSHQILLLNTPRDYYVSLSISGGVRDKLTHAGIYGVNVSEETLNMLYDIKLDNYFKINFVGFKKIIDALGGITVNSDYAFTSDAGYSFVKGDNVLNGEKALSFARERHAFANGDNQRGIDQMKVITAVFHKMTTPAVLNNYTGLLKGLEGSFETDLSYDAITNLVKGQLNDGAKWNIASYAVTGTGSKSSTFSMSQKVYVMIPDKNSVAYAKELIKDLEEGKTVTVKQ